MSRCSNNRTQDRRRPTSAPLLLEVLESRTNPYAVWPIAGGPAAAPLLTTYAEYTEFNPSTQNGLNQKIHGHEGIDIQAPAAETTRVTAVMPGIIVDLSKDLGYNSWIIIKDLAGDAGWNYKHVIPDATLRPGDPVTVTTFLGFVAKTPANEILPHVHLDRGNRPDTDQEGHATWFAPNLNPLSEFDPANDTQKPVIGEVKFRKQLSDVLGDNAVVNGPAGGSERVRVNARYFKETVAQVGGGSIPLVGFNAKTTSFDGTGGDRKEAGNVMIDIIADVTDLYGTAANPGTRPVGTYHLGFSFSPTDVPGFHPDEQIGESVTSIHLSGMPHWKSVKDVATINSARHIYSNDRDANSKLWTGPYFHTLTNTSFTSGGDGDFVNDRKFYWNARAKVGTAWNSDVPATSNANSMYPDGIYSV